MSEATPQETLTPEAINESLKERLAGTFPGNLGLEPIEVAKESSRGRMVVDRRHLHPGGYVHGGAWTGLADTVAAWATFTNIPPGADFTTVELKLSVFKAGREGDVLEAVATPLHVGRSTIVLEVRVLRDGDHVAHMTLTQFVFPPRESISA